MGLTDTREGGAAAAAADAGPPLRIWCLLRDQQAHVEPVKRHFGAAAEFVYDAGWSPEAMLDARPDLVLCVNDYPYDISRCLDAARASGIPSLVLQDGILEWRCQYENPLFGAGGGAPQHQPVLADRIACLGPQSARQIAAWGNQGKAVATGMPRLDYLIGRPRPEVRRPGNRVLVMTAKNPGFTPEQVEVTVRSLRDVKARLDQLDVAVVWRTAGKVTRELGVESQMQECASEELVDILGRVDAVVTTPSTAMLEAMLLGRPVAAVDYHNVPRFVPTAWTIGAPDQVAPVLAELLLPPARKMAFQEDCLHDALACDGPASPRVAALIRRMVGRPGGEVEPAAPSRTSAATLSDLYPEEPTYADHDVASLQARLVRLQKQNADLRRERDRFTLGKGLHTFGRQVLQVLRGRSERP